MACKCSVNTAQEFVVMIVLSNYILLFSSNAELSSNTNINVKGKSFYIEILRVSKLQQLCIYTYI